MTTITLTLTLLSDAEPGTGLGMETVDGIVPKNAQGQPVLPATHLKGLLRDQLQGLAAAREWPHGEELIAHLLGTAGMDGGDGRSSALQLTDAAPAVGTAVQTLTIARTAVGNFGTVVPNSLRTVEAMATGSRFTAAVRIQDEPGSVADLATRLGFLSLECIGGGRTRGAGLCRIEIPGETRTPGALLRELEQRLPSGIAAEEPDTAHQARTAQAVVLKPGAPHWFRLVFRADSAICCPEIPVNGATNHIRSGPVVPASAVQGALITRLAAVSTALADACLADGRFRAWPLVPVLPGDASADEEVPVGVRVDLTHRMSKLPTLEDGGHLVRDTAIAPYHWSDVEGGSPLKSSDGILRRDRSGAVTLWKAAELPRLIRGHGVHDDASGEGHRTLFSVEALAPMVYSGLVALPAEAASALEKAMQNDPVVSFGKARSVRGTGRLHLQPVEKLDSVLPTTVPGELPGQVFIVQSPLALPDDYQVGRAESALQYLAEKAGWGQVLMSSNDEKDHAIARTAATCGVRFGWNRHGIGNKADARHRRLRARRVILPGSVLVLAQPLADAAMRLLTGLGDGRECGFGGLLPHPGMAAAIPYRQKSRRETIRSTDEAGRLALELFCKAHGGMGPSPSQIAAVGRRVGQDAAAYLDKQRSRGSTGPWHRWQPVFEDVKKLVQGNPDQARITLRAWQDLAVIHRSSGKEQRS